MHLKFSRVHWTVGWLSLHETKPLSALDCLQKFILEFLHGVVAGQVQQVEAGVGDRQVTGAFSFLNVNLDAFHPSQRNSVAAREEHEEFLLVFLGQLFENLPEINNGWTLGRVAIFVGAIFLQLVPLVILIADNQAHQLLGAKQMQDSASLAHAQEAFLESLERFSTGRVENVVDVQFHVVGFVVLGHSYFPSFGFQRHGDYFSEMTFRDAEIQAERFLHIGFTVVEEVLQRLSQYW